MSKYPTQEMSFMANNWEKKMYLNFLEVFMETAGDACSACSIFYLNFLSNAIKFSTPFKKIKIITTLLEA